MEYLGFKSTNDPLFKAETTMMRLKDLAGDREVEFYEAVDAFSQNAEEANSMAFVSSWGESNPGGGKDRVRLVSRNEFEGACHFLTIIFAISHLILFFICRTSNPIVY